MPSIDQGVAPDLTCDIDPDPDTDTDTVNIKNIENKPSRRLKVKVITRESEFVFRLIQKTVKYDSRESCQDGIVYCVFTVFNNGSIKQRYLESWDGKYSDVSMRGLVDNDYPPCDTDEPDWNITNRISGWIRADNLNSACINEEDFMT